MGYNTSVNEAVKRIGGIEVTGLVRKTGVLKKAVVETAEEVLGFNYIIHEQGGTCYAYYAANPPLIGMTEPQPTACPLGVEAFGEFKVDYKQAVNIFHSGNWGSGFSSMVLSKPLTYPEAQEPFWYMVSNLGTHVVIGADSGTVYYPK